MDAIWGSLCCSPALTVSVPVSPSSLPPPPHVLALTAGGGSRVGSWQSPPLGDGPGAEREAQATTPPAAGTLALGGHPESPAFTSTEGRIGASPRSRAPRTGPEQGVRFWKWRARPQVPRGADPTFTLRCHRRPPAGPRTDDSLGLGEAFRHWLGYPAPWRHVGAAQSKRGVGCQRPGGRLTAKRGFCLRVPEAGGPGRENFGKIPLKASACWAGSSEVAGSWEPLPSRKSPPQASNLSLSPGTPPPQRPHPSAAHAAPLPPSLSPVHPPSWPCFLPREPQPHTMP